MADHEQILEVHSEGPCRIDMVKEEVDVAIVRIIYEEGVNSERDVLLIHVELKPCQCYVLALLFGRVEVVMHSLVQGFASNIGERGERLIITVFRFILPSELVSVIVGEPFQYCFEGFPRGIISLLVLCEVSGVYTEWL